MKKTIAAIAATLALSACAGSTSVLTDSSFILTELNGSEYEAVAEDTAAIDFKDGSVYVNLGGNSIFSNYKEGKNQSISFSDGGSTKMMVPEEIREDEFIDALYKVVSYSVDGDVVSFEDKDGVTLFKAVRK